VPGGDLAQLGQLLADRGRARQHDDPRAVAAGEPHEAAQDGPVAGLVLGAADRDEDAGSGTRGVGWHASSLLTRRLTPA
jgi:hypothetical protein